MSQPQNIPKGPPYLAPVAQIGGIPTVSIDVPALAVLIALYIVFGAINMTIFQTNRHRGYKFIPSVALFGFCMSRVVTCALRIAYAIRHTNVRLAIAAGIFVNAGILIIYILNLIFAQRILRAKKPSIGWHPILKIVLRSLYCLIAAALIMVITATVISFYTLNMSTRRIARDMQRAAITYLLIITVLPLALLLASFLPPRHWNEEKFGKGSMKAKAVIVACSSTLSILIAGFKAGTAWESPRPINQPAWFHSKAAFYVFNFTLEIIILIVLTSSRIEKRFYVPDGSKKAGDYSRQIDLSEGENSTAPTLGQVKSATDLW